MKNFKDLEKKLIDINNINEKKLFEVKFKMKKTISSFTEFQFAKKINTYLQLFFFENKNYFINKYSWKKFR